jgi:sulfotransferase
MKIFFNSSLPRSGSTLLQNIVGQNPDFYVTPTSGVLELLHGSRVNFTSSPEFKAQDFLKMSEGFKGFCKEGLLGFYKNITDKKFVLDKSRGWGIHFNFLNEFYPDPKIICMVRDLRAIVSSMEIKYRQQTLLNSPQINHQTLTGTTLIKRVNDLLNGIPIGLALNRLHDILQQKISEKILFIKYEDLCLNPDSEITKIYNFLNIPSFSHNFLDIKQITQEDDEIYGITNLHTINTTLSKSKNNPSDVLGEDTCAYLYNNFNWFFEFFKYEY